MPTPRTRLGDFGERAAANHLAGQGYRLIERKWRCDLGEIDLIMHDGLELVFVEVRARRREYVPEESVGIQKRRKLIALAYSYLNALPQSPEPAWRIDVVAITIGSDGRIARLHHIRNAIEEEQ